MNDRDYNELIHWPLVRRGTCVETTKGKVDRFYVQLELNLSPTPVEDTEWRDIAWFDHQPDHPNGHDLSYEGLHMDLRHPTEGSKKVTAFPSYPIEEIPYFSEQYFDENYAKICDRYIKWSDTERSEWLTTLPTPL